MDRRGALIGTLVLGLGASASAQTAPPRGTGPSQSGPPDPRETIDLWPDGAPGMPVEVPVETVEERSRDPGVADRAVHGVARPRLAVFRPQKPNGTAVLIFPGGGYRRIVIDKEGYETARWLVGHGYTAFVLFYRLPGEGWTAGPDVALADAQRAMRIVRARAANYGIQQGRMVAMGFSAGGHLCGDLATRFDLPLYTAIDDADRLSSRPDAAALLYAVQSMRAPLAHAGSRELLLGGNAGAALERAHTPALHVTDRTPPCFLVHAEDDGTVPVENTLEMRAALKARGVSAETHLFAQGGHGFGIGLAAGKPAAAWPELFRQWVLSLELA
ncbi:alpha/beta hydrolase [Sphingomonas sp. TDK1]|uniref:alpha/beta hydrolase n=1 Tax=Sphingomonas sp. TDK1 TaxID=453247 RepID=UPI001E29C45E|nr:alpha/beta hydrolase [Sphingomonas sp. TDK1]